VLKGLAGGFNFYWNLLANKKDGVYTSSFLFIFTYFSCVEDDEQPYTPSRRLQEHLLVLAPPL